MSVTVFLIIILIIILMFSCNKRKENFFIKTTTGSKPSACPAGQTIVDNKCIIQGCCNSSAECPKCTAQATCQNDLGFTGTVYNGPNKTDPIKGKNVCYAVSCANFDNESTCTGVHLFGKEKTKVTCKWDKDPNPKNKNQKICQVNNPPKHYKQAVSRSSDGSGGFLWQSFETNPGDPGSSPISATGYAITKSAQGIESATKSISNTFSGW